MNKIYRLKKIIAFILALTMSAALLSACDSKEDKKDKDNKESSSQAEKSDDKEEKDSSDKSDDGDVQDDESDDGDDDEDMDNDEDGRGDVVDDNCGDEDDDNSGSGGGNGGGSKDKSNVVLPTERDDNNDFVGIWMHENPYVENYLVIFSDKTAYYYGEDADDTLYTWELDGENLLLSNGLEFEYWFVDDCIVDQYRDIFYYTGYLPDWALNGEENNTNPFIGRWKSTNDIADYYLVIEKLGTCYFEGEGMTDNVYEWFFEDDKLYILDLDGSIEGGFTYTYDASTQIITDQYTNSFYYYDSKGSDSGGKVEQGFEAINAFFDLEVEYDGGGAVEQKDGVYYRSDSDYATADCEWEVFLLNYVSDEDSNRLSFTVKMQTMTSDMPRIDGDCYIGTYLGLYDYYTGECFTGEISDDEFYGEFYIDDEYYRVDFSIYDEWLYYPSDGVAAEFTRTYTVTMPSGYDGLVLGALSFATDPTYEDAAEGKEDNITLESNEEIANALFARFY